MGLEVNFSSIISKLKDIEKKASREIIDNALKAGGEVVLESLKLEVAVNVYDTGELYDSLNLGEIRGAGTNKKILIGSQSNDRKVVERNYYNEYGTSSIVGKKHNKRAFQNSKKEANRAIIESIQKDLKSRG